MLRWVLAIGVWFATAAGAYAQDQVSQALRVITDAADHICGNIAMSGQSTDVKITGDVKAQLSCLAKKLADLGIAGAGEVTTGSFEGLLRDQLASSLKEQRDCKVAIFSSLRDVLFPPAPPQRSRNPDGLYQYGEQVADGVGGVVDQSNGVVSFQAIRSAGRADPTRDFEFRDWTLSCPDIPRPPTNAIVRLFISQDGTRQTLRLA
jgi:hypothetical protein